MNTDTTDANTRSRPSDLSPETVFSLLADDRRRYAMEYLGRRVGAIPLGDVAEQVALREGCPSRDHFERVITGLHHVHVPRLVEAGVVRYDSERVTIERQPAAAQLSPYMGLAATDDVR